jgi:hypothetical protein
MTAEHFASDSQLREPSVFGGGAILAVARKGLHSPFETDFWWMAETGCGGAKKNNEKQKCALFGLWALISSSEWGDHEVEAWNILSDAIVGRKPPLPTATRAWLFK